MVGRRDLDVRPYNQMFKGKVFWGLDRATYGGCMSNAASSSTMGLRPNSSARRIA